MKKTKTISILLIIIQIFTLLTNLNIVKANIKEGDTVLLKGDHECDSLLEYWMEDYNKWSYKIVWYVYYIDAQTGNKYPAFCVEPAKQGVGTGYSEYNATISKEKDNSIWRILSKGYMGSNYKEWNLECDDDLYSATKVALHSYAEKRAPKDKYILGNRSVDGNTVEEIQRRGAKVLDVAQKLYEYGINGKETYEEPKVNITKDGENKIEVINGEEYYTQSYKVSANKSLKSYKISIENFVSETKVLSSNNKESSNFEENYFKIAIPTKNIKESINGKIYVKDAQVKTCPVFYAQSSVSKAQSYVTYTSSYEVAQNSINMQVDPNNSILEIAKIDAENKAPIANVVFEISNEKNEKIGEYATNENGIIKVENLKPEIVKIKEIKTDEKYVLNSEEVQVELQWGKTSKIQIENERKKGNLKILKVDKANKQIKLAGVEFKIYNSKNELVKTLTTDENGEATIKGLDIGKYVLKETRTNEKYILETNEKEITILWNEENKQLIENEKKTGNLKIVKTDLENKEIKLEAVEFELYNEDGKLVTKIATDRNGEAKVENLEIGTYTLKEVKTNENYILNKEDINVEIKWKEETKLEVQNEKIKGQIKIIKTSKNDNEITGEKAGSPIADVAFEIKDEQGNVVETLTTNKLGEALSRKLEKGKYTVKEIKANKNYQLDTTEYILEIKENEEIVNLQISNKSKIKLPRTGF